MFPGPEPSSNEVKCKVGAQEIPKSEEKPTNKSPKRDGKLKQLLQIFFKLLTNLFSLDNGFDDTKKWFIRITGALCLISLIVLSQYGYEEIGWLDFVEK